VSENTDLIGEVLAGWLKGDPATLGLLSNDVVYVAPQPMVGGGTLTIERNRATGKRSGATLDMETGSIWTIRDGKVARWEGFASPLEALAAAGLRE
jgi:ketosteroid isomerase-like protein